MTDQAPAPIGHNRPSLDVLTAAELIEDHKDRLVTRKTLQDDFDALKEPPESAEDVAAYQAWALRAQAFLKATEEKRIVLKEPYKLVADAIDGFFNGDLRNTIAPLKVKAESRVGAYQQAQEALRRLVELKAANEARAAEEAKRKEAEQASAAGDHSTAEVAERQATALSGSAAFAERRATAAGADLRRVSTEAGTTGSRSVLRWTFDRKKVDLKVLRSYLSDQAISDAIAAYAKAPANTEACKAAARNPAANPLKGVTFTEEIKASFRGA